MLIIAGRNARGVVAVCDECSKDGEEADDADDLDGERWISVKTPTGLAVITLGPKGYNVVWIAGGERVVECLGGIASLDKAVAMAGAGSSVAYFRGQAEAEEPDEQNNADGESERTLSAKQPG
jgi:hypothetical protein